MKRLDQVEKNAAKNNKEMKAAIKKMRKKSREVKRSRNTVAGFAGGFFTAHILYDWLWGWHWWWGPWGGWCPGFIEINIGIWDIWVDGYDYDWDLVDDYVDTSGLGLDNLAIDDADLTSSDAFLDSGDFSPQEGDLSAITSGLDHGWDDVTTDTGTQVRESYESNLDNQAIYEREVPMETFQDYGMGDFGGDFGGMDF